MNGKPDGRPDMPPDKSAFKKVGLFMNIFMGATMSLCLSFVGLFRAGQLSLPSLLINFGVSFVISFVIGLLIPIQKVGGAVSGAMKLKPRSIPALLVESVISDLIYTPVLTFAMVTIAYISATSHGAQLNYVPMLLGSMLISLLIGYVLIVIVTPLYLGLSFKLAGVHPPEPKNK